MQTETDLDQFMFRRIQIKIERATGESILYLNHGNGVLDSTDVLTTEVLIHVHRHPVYVQ